MVANAANWASALGLITFPAGALPAFLRTAAPPIETVRRARRFAAMWSPLRRIGRFGGYMQRKPLTLNVLALDGPPGPKRLWERDRSWPAPSIARIPGCSSGHREPVRPSAARRLGPRYRRCWTCSTGSSLRQPGQPHADVGPFAASDLFFSFLAPPFPEKRRRPAHGVKRPPPLAASLWMRDDDVPRVAQTSSWSRLCSMVPGAVRWLIWSLRQGKLISSFFFVRTPSCFVQTMDQKAVGYRMLYGPARINGRDA